MAFMVQSWLRLSTGEITSFFFLKHRSFGEASATASVSMERGPVQEWEFNENLF